MPGGPASAGHDRRASLPSPEAADPSAPHEGARTTPPEPPPLVPEPTSCSPPTHETACSFLDFATDVLMTDGAHSPPTVALDGQAAFVVRGRWKGAPIPRRVW
jgi:hypothetical protein